jgi:hypothetical protein
MKQLFLYLSTALIMIGCTQIEEPVPENATEPEGQQFDETVQTRAGANPITLKP